MTDAKPTPIEAPPDHPTVAPRGFTLKIGLAEFGLMGALYTPVLLTMALRVSEVDHDNMTASLSLILGTGALAALIANPIFGRLSDRTTSRFGRRRPWLVGGVVVAFIGMFLIAFVPSIPVILTGWVLVQIAYNATLASLQATVPDQVPTKQFGRVSGVIGFAQTITVIVCVPIASLFSNVRMQFILPALLAVALVGFFAFTLPDHQFAATHARFSVRELLGSFWTNPIKHRDFGWAWLSKFLVSYGTIAPGSYLVYFLVTDFKESDEDAGTKVAFLVIVSYGLMAATAAIGGWASDRMGGRRKPLLIVSSMVQFLGLGVLAFAHSYDMVVVSQVLIGIGGGLFYGVDLALTTQVLPDLKQAAKDLGVMNMANVLPQTLAPFIATVIFAIGGSDNFRLFFCVAAVISLLGTLTIPRIRGVR